MPTEDELRNRTMEEEHTERERVWEYEHRHGPTTDDAVEAELVSPHLRRRYREQEPFNA